MKEFHIFSTYILWLPLGGLCLENKCKAFMESVRMSVLLGRICSSANMMAYSSAFRTECWGGSGFQALVIFKEGMCISDDTERGSARVDPSV